MSDAFQLRLAGFEGTADELLDDVRRRRRAPETLQISAATSQILDRVEQVTADLDRTGELAAQLSRLMLLKAGALLFEQGEEEELAGPRRVAGRVSVEGAMRLGQREGCESFAPMGQPDLVERQRDAWPVQALVDARRALSFRRQPATTVRVPSFASLELTVSRLLRRLGRGKVRLSQLLQQASRPEAVTHFLAVLELVKSGRATARQRTLAGDITLEGTARGDERVTAV